MLVSRDLVPYLPKPDIKLVDSGYAFDWSSELSIGKVSGFWGIFLFLSAPIRIFCAWVRRESGLRPSCGVERDYLLSRLKGRSPFRTESDACMSSFFSLED